MKRIVLKAAGLARRAAECTALSVAEFLGATSEAIEEEQPS
jgi:hypothetical protein